MQQKIKEISFKFAELAIDRLQVSVTLDFPGGASEPFNSYVDEAWQFAKGLQDITVAYTISAENEPDEKEPESTIAGITIKVGKKIKQEIAGSEWVAFFICTPVETISHWAKTLLTGEIRL